MLCPAETALARSNAYGLIARLLLGDLKEETIELCRSIPEIASIWVETYGEISNETADEAAADHYALFGRQVFPFGGFFLSLDGLVGGESTQKVYQLYHDLGFDPPSLDSHSADHIGVELQFLGYMAYREAWALGEDNGEAADFYQQKQQDFLHLHLMAWILPLYVAAGKEPFPFWYKLLNVVVRLLQDHLHDQGTNPMESGAVFTKNLDIAVEWLQHPETGIGAISRRLAHPGESGFHLSQGQIKDLAAGAGIPLGFDSRELALKSLLETAINYEVLPRLLSLFVEVAQGWRQDFAALGETFLPWTQVWMQKVDDTILMLQTMHEATVRSQQNNGAEVHP